MKEHKLSHIGIVFSSGIVGMKVWDCLLEIIAQNVANNIGSLGNLKSTAGLSMIELNINIMMWIGAWKIEAFMIGLKSELFIRTGTIMKKKMMKSMFGRKDSDVQEI